jgi:hypothetical protein
MDAIDANIYGRYNHVKSVNPYKCRHVVIYNNIEIYGKNLFNTGWDSVPNGFSDFRYELSTGHIIKIPKYRAIKPMIEVSFGLDNSKIFHFVNVACLADLEVVTYKIVLRQDNIVPQKIGDIIMSRSKLPENLDAGWKFTDYGR